MIRKYSTRLVAILIVVAILAWAPWISKSYAMSRAVQVFNQNWEGIIDGCGTNCLGCGAVAARRIPFGVQVTVEFACGMIPADLPQYHLFATGFVSLAGTVHGLTHP